MMASTRVRRRRPRVPPRKGLQPLPQFGAGGDAIDWSNLFLGMMGVPPVYHIKKPKQKGGRLTPRQMRTLMRATDPRCLGIFPKRGQRGGAMSAWLDEIDRSIRSWHNPNWKDPLKKQRGAGLFSFITRPLARLFGKKVTKQAAKAVAKRVTKKAAKKAAAGVVTAGASWATRKALDQI